MYSSLRKGVCMKFKHLFLYIIVALFSSCAGVSKVTFREAPMRHGIIPREKKSTDNVRQWMKEASLARGKLLYSMNCIECHGPAGKGDGEKAGKLKHKPVNLVQLVNDVPDFTFFLAISQWSGEMPGWKHIFSDVDREDLVAYIKTFRP